jgi:endonuclease YncB( thermonuclease family)
MLTAISAILAAIADKIAAAVKFIPWWVWVSIAIFLFGGWVFHGGSCRDFACSRTPKPRPIKWSEYTVSKVVTGTSIESRLGKRQRRVRTINLINICSPSDGALAEQSRTSLERLAGTSIRVQRQGIFATTDEEIKLEKQLKSDEDIVESSDEESAEEPAEAQLIVGVIYGNSGQCLNTEQVRLGMAKLLPEAPKAWKAFEDEAKKKKLGVWK